MFLESSPDYQRSEALVRLFKQFAIVASILALTAFFTGCAGLSSSASSQSDTPSNVTITLSPATATIPSGGSQQFVATVTSTSNTAVVWHASAGTISSSGLFTAPSVTAPTSVIISASSSTPVTPITGPGRPIASAAIVSGSVTSSAQVTVNPAGALAISTQALPGSDVGVPYSAGLTATGGVAPYQWQITAGTLPAGLTLDPSSGMITGTPSQSGTSNFTTFVTDAKSHTASQPLSLTATGSSSNANYDGPAELPLVYVQTSMADTPAPGSVISVPQGGDLQQALNSVKCGDTIQLQAGAVYTGSFTFPALSCDNAHWIIVRTSAPDSSLPAENTRLTPCYAGVTSLPGRPALNCASSTNVLAKLQLASEGSGPITLANGANHYRFLGLEVTRTPGTGVVYNLAFDQSGAADYVIFDRSWFHGTAQDETERGVMLSGVTYGAVIDSYFSDFHCISVTGSCVDSQAVAGGIGDLASGPLKVVDNFLEAAGECFILGGGTATATPTDIEVSYNHFFKPMTWLKGQPGYVGGANGNPFIVKNHFELKNAERVLFEGNILDDTWGGFSQAGFAILLTPKNQAIGTANVCPACQVTNVTIRYSTISHVGGVMQIGNGLSANGGPPLAGERYSIHDITADDVNATLYAGYGTFAQVSMGPGAPVLQYVTINHVTAFEPTVMLNLGDDLATNPVMNNFVFTNNIVNAGSYPTQTTGSGGTTDCAYYSAPLTALTTCFQPYTFSHNAIIATPAVYPASKYPSGNFFPATVSAVDFVNYNNGNGGNYQLQNSSPYKNAGTDGLDLGANIAAIQAAIAGVQ
jgi:hypothetical protein